MPKPRQARAASERRGPEDRENALREEDTPLDPAAFAPLLERLGPFETAPVLAVAVSGGADSLALCLLADDWARRRGGAVVGLTVDHRLRPESTAEAERVGGWLAARGIAHHILPWTDAPRPTVFPAESKPATGIQAAARRARYDLLRRWCAQAGILHLLLAHHQQDQAETLLARLARGSGADGLAAMAPLVELPELRLLRPLLEVPRQRLAASLRAWGQDWVEDPSNGDGRYQRVRLRRLLPELAGEGLGPARLAATARHLGRARAALERMVAELSARAVVLHPAGFARLDAALLAAAPAETGLRLLDRLCRTIGGGLLPPRLERLERLYRAVCGGGLAGGRTFAGCVLVPERGAVLICREPAAAEGSRMVRAGERVLWDGRYVLGLGGRGQGWIRALGAEGLAALREMRAQSHGGGGGAGGIPALARRALPALYDEHGISEVPFLGYNRSMPGGLFIDHYAFTPGTPLAGAGYCLV